MGLPVNDVKEKVILYVPGTVGGGTYYIESKPLCLSPISELGKEDQLCSRGAGYGTDHQGTGRCMYHGGRRGVTIKHGRYADVTKKQLRAQMSKFEEEDAQVKLNLLPELDVQRALLADMMIMYQEGGRRNPDMVRVLQSMINDIGKMVDRVEKMQDRRVLTISTAKLMMSRALEVAARFIPKEQMQEFIFAWREEVTTPLSPSGENGRQKQLERIHE